MIITALLRAPRMAPPVGSLSLRPTVSLVSAISSSMISKVKVTLVSPSAKSRAPAVET